MDQKLTLMKHSLAAVNFFLGLVGVVQVSRILMYQQSQKKKAIEEAKGENKVLAA